MKKIGTIIALFMLVATTMLSAQTPVIIDVSEPGTSENSLYDAESATAVKITGKIDARDFEFMNYALLAVKELDLSEASIVAYFDGEYSYADNEFPEKLSGMRSLQKVILPASTTKIKNQALVMCPELASIVIPGTVIPSAEMIVEADKLSKVTLYVHGSILKDYKNATNKKAWGFANIVAIEGTGTGEPEPTPTATFTLTQAKGKALNIKLIASSGKLQADWGDGKLHDIVVSDEIPTNLADVKATLFTPTVDNPTIKLYGEGLQMVNFARFYLSEQSPTLQAVDLQNAPELEVLILDNANLSAINLEHNPKIKLLHVFGNFGLKNLDISHNPLIEELYVQYTSIGSLNLGAAQKLRTLNMERTQIKTLDASACPNLESLFASSSQVAEINIANCNKLYDFRVGETPLKTLKMGNNTAMNNFQVYSCPLPTIDFEAIPNVQKLFFDHTLVQKADLSKLDKVTAIGANECQLKVLKVSPKAMLDKFFIYGNQLDACALDSLYDALPASTTKRFIVVSAGDALSNPGIATSKTFIAQKKGYTLWDDTTQQERTGDGTGCKNDLSIENITTTSALKQFAVYPTASDDKIYISGPESVVRATLIDLSGKSCAQFASSTSLQEISIKDVAKGEYILLVETQKGTAETHWIYKK